MQMLGETMFRSVRPWRTRQAVHSLRFQSTSSFDPRIRGGRDPVKYEESGLLAKFRSARPCRTRRVIKWAVSAVDLFRSARPWRTRPTNRDGFSPDRVFRSARPRGTRHVTLMALATSVAVSIHASAGDATVTVTARNAGEYMFRSTRPRGTRPPSTQSHAAYAIWFRSTRPRGTRRGRLGASSSLSGFDPRVRGGRDHVVDDTVTDPFAFRSARP